MTGWLITASAALGSAHLGLLVLSIQRRSVLSVLCAAVGLALVVVGVTSGPAGATADAALIFAAVALVIGMVLLVIGQAIGDYCATRPRKAPDMAAQRTDPRRPMPRRSGSRWPWHARHASGPRTPPLTTVPLVRAGASRRSTRS